MFVIPDLTHIVADALAEDLGVSPQRFLQSGAGSPDVLERDVTSFPILGVESAFSGLIVARSQCVVCGLPVAAATFEALSAAAGLLEPIDFFPLVAEGAVVEPGTVVAEVQGMATAVLTAERTALDFMMILSGIATTTSQWQQAAGPDLLVCDTRKTCPGMRALSKYAVTVGGGTNHRAGLYDMVLIKDNHIARAGGIGAAVTKARAAHPDLVIEAEADSLDQALEAVRARVDIVLLDNMNDAEIATAVAACRELAGQMGTSVLLEASGGMTLDRVAALRTTGVDRVSTSAVTLAPPVDFGFDEASTRRK